MLPVGRILNVRVWDSARCFQLCPDLNSLYWKWSNIFSRNNFEQLGARDCRPPVASLYEQVWLNLIIFKTISMDIVGQVKCSYHSDQLERSQASFKPLKSYYRVLWRLESQKFLSHFNRVGVKNGHFTVKMTVMGVGGLAPPGPNRKQMWNFYHFFLIEILIDTQNTFIALWRVTKCIFHALFGAFKKRASLLQMIILRAAALRGGIGDSSSWMKITFFLCKIRFRTHIFIN